MSKLRSSASVALSAGWDRHEVFLVLRNPTHRAFPDTYVFPGGKIDPEDRDLPVLSPVAEVAPEAYVAAARELFEETGVLVARPRAGGRLDPARLARHREGLLSGSVPFRQVLADLDAGIDGRLLVPLGEKTTPPFHPLRFKNRFFLAVLPEGQEPSVIPGELTRGDWFRPWTAVARFERGELRIAPPILMLLETWGQRAAGVAIDDLRRFDDSAFVDRPLRIRFSPDSFLFPGRTPTLPPATHTNTYLVGRDRLLVVDPATDDPGDQAKLGILLDELAAEGRTVEAIFLTHHHEDHVGALDFVRDRTGAPVWAHPDTVRLMPGLVADRELLGGEVLELGEAGEVEVIHTPGHAPGHLCLFQRRWNALYAGDMVSTASTILVEPPEGDMGLYLASLELLRRFDARILYPAHGDPAPRVEALLQEFLAHRRERQGKILSALGTEPATLEQLLPAAYADKPREIWPLAKRSLLAGLLLLETEGHARRHPDERWSLPD